MKVQPVTLAGRAVRLEPLRLTHLEDFCNAGLDKELWRFTAFPRRPPADMQAYIAGALQGQSKDNALAFATCLAATGQAIGSTRFGNIDPVNHPLEIGWTWIARQWPRTVINTEAGYLMLRHAFETLGCLRVEFGTDMLNERWRRAILRWGAQEEGILHNHMIASGAACGTQFIIASGTAIGRWSNVAWRRRWQVATPAARPWQPLNNDGTLPAIAAKQGESV